MTGSVRKHLNGDAVPVHVRDPPLAQFRQVRQMLHHLLSGGVRRSEVIGAHLRINCFVAEMLFECDHFHDPLTRSEANGDELRENRSLANDARPLIVTAQLDDASQRYFDGLRKQHFPPERNHLSAHLTMFHALPGDAVVEIRTVLAAAARRDSSVPARICGLRFLGSGVAFNVHSPELERIREAIGSGFKGGLTAQDRQTWRPHITVQNKVSREIAAELLASLQRDFRPWAISIQGIDLWRYDGGPWEFASPFHFGTRETCTGLA